LTGVIATLPHRKYTPKTDYSSDCGCTVSPSYRKGNLLRKLDDTCAVLCCGQVISTVCLSEGWLSNKRLPVSHLLDGFCTPSLSTGSGGPLCSGEENRNIKKQQEKGRSFIKKERKR
jgi:SET domain-containing protein